MGIFKPNIEQLKQKGDIKGLVKALQDGREQSIRTSHGSIKKKTSDLAAEALIELGDRSAVPELIKVVERAPDHWLEAGKRGLAAEQHAIRVLGELGDKRAVPALVGALAKTISLGEHPAAKALGQLGDPAAVPALLDLLGSSDLPLRKGAIEALGQLGSKETVSALANLLDDSEVCFDAIIALGEIGDNSVIPQLVEVGKKGDKSTRYAVFAALIKLQDKTAQALPMAIETLEADLRVGLKGEEQTRALRYLCGLDKPEVVPLLLASLPYLTNAELQWRINMAIGKGIVGWRSPSKDCIETIGRLGGKEHIPQLEKIKRNLDEHDRNIVDEAITELKKH